MALIPKNNLVEEAIEFGSVIVRPRPHLGFSQLGNKCKRKLWYDFRWAYTQSLSPRVVRLFARGDMEEPIVIADLERAGMTVTDVQKELSDDTGHVLGHIDGIVHNVPDAPATPHLLEIKTMNDKRFAAYKKQGLQLTNPVYYVQMQLYMGKLGLTRALFVVTNKNDESRAYERFHFDKRVYEDYLAYADEIVHASTAPDKIGGPTWMECKFCAAKGICHEKKPVNINCRTCQHAEIYSKGRWKCNRYGTYLERGEQEAGCSAWEGLETFKGS